MGIWTKSVLNNLSQLAQPVYYGREYEEKKERQKKTKELAEALVMAVRTILKQPEKNAQRDPGEKRLAITVERRGTSSGIALRHLSCPRLHVWSARDHTGGETAPRNVSFRGRTFKTTRTEGT